ncbi:MAG: hypothetical protein PHW80_09195 [Smithellaceae bacterium]|nr:hypothetical protein [Smithellaceae bacterium]MDD3259094.1 hypothetical protein [Smithellaceae bacterium]MDD3849463.1 hypothetical protein [Smithellaceae bacterium]
MKKALCIMLILIVSFLFAAQSLAAEDSYAKPKATKELTREKLAFRNYSGEGSSTITSFCMEGQVFIMMSSDNSFNFTILQVYTDKDGKAVPKTCN